jgi:hypothetical protein
MSLLDVDRHATEGHPDLLVYRLGHPAAWPTAQPTAWQSDEVSSTSAGIPVCLACLLESVGDPGELSTRKAFVLRRAPEPWQPALLLSSTPGHIRIAPPTALILWLCCGGCGPFDAARDSDRRQLAELLAAPAACPAAAALILDVASHHATMLCPGLLALLVTTPDPGGPRPQPCAHRTLPPRLRPHSTACRNSAAARSVASPTPPRACPRRRGGGTSWPGHIVVCCGRGGGGRRPDRQARHRRRPPPSRALHAQV